MEVELTPSVPVEETPSETVIPEVPAEVVEETPAVEETPKVEEVLYELPDGRKVDAVTLQKEWKENFLPDYTKKSQTLAELTKPKDENVPEWKREGYVPKSYAEIIEIAEKQALERIAQAGEAEEKQRLEIAAAVDSQIAALKTKDPKLDENALFAHANKYGFRDLNQAYENYSAMNRIAVVTEERVLKGVKGKTDQIATGGTGGGAPGGGVDYSNIHSYSGAQEFFSRVKGKK